MLLHSELQYAHVPLVPYKLPPPPWEWGNLSENITKMSTYILFFKILKSYLFMVMLDTIFCI